MSVAPHVGAWIETLQALMHSVPQHVAPHVGAWIETITLRMHNRSITVAPHVGAWIETNADAAKWDAKCSRTSCRCVD